MPGTDLTTQPPERGKRGEYRVSPKVRRAIEAMASGEAKTQQAAAEMAGMTPRALSQALKRPAVDAYRVEMAKHTLRTAVPRAARRMVDLMDQDSNQLVALRASTFTLAAGAAIMPPQTAPNIHINNNVSVGYVLDLRSDEQIARDAAAGRGPVIDAEAVDVTPS
jgi:hypothetical protein